MSTDNPSSVPNEEAEPAPERGVEPQAGAAKHVSEELFRLLVENATDYAIFLLDPNGNVASWNAGAERIKGYKADEIIGQHFSRFYLPHDVAADRPGKELRIARAEGRYQEEAWRVRQDGSRFFANVVITALRDQNGTLLGFSKITRDVTARQETEEEQRERAQEQVARSFLRDVLSSVTEGRLRFCDHAADLPMPLGEDGDFFPLTPTTLSSLRQRTHEAARAAGLAEERAQDLMTAVSEAGMNAVVHAAGAEARIGSSPTGTVQVWIRDAGTGIAVPQLHRATLERGFTTKGSLGHGFWLMLRTVDRLWLLTGPSGTNVVLEEDRQPSPPTAFL